MYRTCLLREINPKEYEVEKPPCSPLDSLFPVLFANDSYSNSTTKFSMLARPYYLHSVIAKTAHGEAATTKTNLPRY